MQTAPGKKPIGPENTRIEELKNDRESGMIWLGFWIFAAVFIACDSWVFSQGYNSFFQTHKTEQEIELQQLKIEETKVRIELLKKKT